MADQEPIAHNAWPNVSIICGECGWLMFPDIAGNGYRPIKRLVFCKNPGCKYERKVFEVVPESALKLKPFTP